jgi:hypothetical protein
MGFALTDQIDGDISMTRGTELLAVAQGAVLLLATPARAGPPRIDNISPLGVQRGVTSEVTISGADLTGNPRLIAPFALRIDPLDPKRSSGGTWVFKATVSPEVAVGVYLVRVQTDLGLSNPYLLAVGQLPQVEEKEDNSSFEAAQALASTPVIVEGQSAGNDVDYFKFAGKKGQMIVIDAQCARIGSGVDPVVRLTTAGMARRFVASADDSPGLLTDARLIAELPEDGDYVVEFSDSKYQGGGRPVYRLLLGAVPMAEEVYPLGGRRGETVGFELRGGTLGAPRVAAASLVPVPGTDVSLPHWSTAIMGMATPAAGPLDVESLHPLVTQGLPELREPADAAAPPVRAVAPVVFNGRIDPPGDEDRFILAVTPGQRLHIEVEASKHGSALDGVIQVLGTNGSVIASADDTAMQVPGLPPAQAGIALADPSLDLTVPGGTSEITLVLRDLEDRGGVGFPYRIVATPLVPTFELNVNEPQVSIPKGGTAAVGVTVARKAYSGPITLTVLDLPPGVTVRPGTIAPGQNVGALSLSGSPSAGFAALPLALLGRGHGPGGPIEVEATRQLVFAQQSKLPTCTMVQHGLAAAPALATPVTLEAPAEMIEVAHGFGGSIPIKVRRARGADAALAVTTLPLPPGLGVPAASIAAKATTATVAVKAELEAPLGPMTIVLEAKGKFATGEQTIAIPAVTLNLVRPAELVLFSSAVEVRPGKAALVKGKIQRKGAFNEPITVRINGLPAGLKADLVRVEAGAAEFAVKIQADAKTAPATVTANLVSLYQVSKKDYPTAPVPLSVKVVPAK